MINKFLTPSSLSEEIRERVIHIEAKIDSVLSRLSAPAGETNVYRGHPDQFFGGITYSQYGEDIIIMNIFHLLGINKPSYIDIGAHHPLNISNTALFYFRGSRGINVEANPNLIEEFNKHRPEDINLNFGVGPNNGTLDFYFIDDWSGRNTFCREVAEEFVRQNQNFSIQKIQQIPVRTIDDIISNYSDGKFPDFISIDVEGFDIDILSTASFDKSRPVVICVEAELNGEVDRASRLISLLRERGYRLYVRTVANLIFVHDNAMASL